MVLQLQVSDILLSHKGSMSNKYQKLIVFTGHSIEIKPLNAKGEASHQFNQAESLLMVW